MVPSLCSVVMLSYTASFDIFSSLLFQNCIFYVSDRVVFNTAYSSFLIVKVDFPHVVESYRLPHKTFLGTGITTIDGAACWQLFVSNSNRCGHLILCARNEVKWHTIILV